MNRIRAVIYPAPDLAASTAAWSKTFGSAPAWESPDYVAFVDGTVEIGLSRLPWFDHPLVFWQADDIEKAHAELLAAGGTAMGEASGGSMAPVGTVQVTNGDPATGIVDVPGRRLAIVKAADGNLIGLMQDLPTAW